MFCSPYPVIDRRLGGPKHVAELADAFRRLGWQADIVGTADIGVLAGVPDPTRYAARLRAYLQEHAGRYDVVEYDHAHLPYPRADFPPRPLLVARSMLLCLHLVTTRIPPRPTLRGWVGRFVRGAAHRRQAETLAVAAVATCAAADLVNLPNRDDVTALVTAGIDPGKLLLLPLGLTAYRRTALAANPIDPPADPRVAFVGTFDPRKGMGDFPTIVDRIASAVPGVRFRLVGTQGLLRTAAEVFGTFPRRLRPLLEVVPEYRPEELPGLLTGCSAGVFPSYVEGFGFGVLEMLAAGLPVVAYNAPGPPEMLPAEYLVPRGDAAGAAAALVGLLTDTERLAAARRWARGRAADFDWDEIAVRTATAYRAAGRGRT